MTSSDERAHTDLVLARYATARRVDAALAAGLAAELHAGQVDRLGEPYVGHVLRVAATAPSFAPGLDAEALRVTGALHDVVEDTPATLADLRALGLPNEVVTAVGLLSHDPSAAYDDYVRGLAGDSLAVAVKRADLGDNGAPARLARLAPDVRERLAVRYAGAVALLDELDGPAPRARRPEA